ncbi:MAG: RNA polymerase sigma factor SigM [Actinomycetales bacterium]
MTLPTPDASSDRAQPKESADPGSSPHDAGPEPSDVALLQAHAQGDPTAFEELVRRHQRRLWAVALRTMRNREDAADALQDAFISVHRNAGSFRGDAQVGTWLYRVVVNACLDRLRRAKARPAVPLPEYDLSTGHDEHARTETQVMLYGALAQLPEHQRAAIVLVDLHELSVLEAAHVLGIAEGTVKSRCSRGRAALAELLREPGDGGPRSTASTSGAPAPLAGPPTSPPSPGTASRNRTTPGRDSRLPRFRGNRGRIWGVRSFGTRLSPGETT